MAVFLRYGISVFAGIMTASVFACLYLWPTWWMLLGSMSMWCIMGGLLYIGYIRVFPSPYPITSVCVTTMVSCLALIMLLETRLSVAICGLCGSASIAFLLGTLRYQQASFDQHMAKPIRRIMMSLVVWSVYIIVATMFAFSLFFPKIPVWGWGLIQTVYVVYATFLIWKLYIPISVTSSALWLLVIAIIQLELFWLFQFFPFGYFASSLLLTWIWYIITLFIRFHVSPQGIIWKKQREFLIINGLLYTAFLVFIIRWI